MPGFDCLICPFGANCSQNIVAKYNFWRFEESHLPPVLKVTICPPGYCGRNEQQIHWNTIVVKETVQAYCVVIVNRATPRHFTPHSVGQFLSAQTIGFGLLQHCTF